MVTSTPTTIYYYLIQRRTSIYETVHGVCIVAGKAKRNRAWRSAVGTSVNTFVSSRWEPGKWLDAVIFTTHFHDWPSIETTSKRRVHLFSSLCYQREATEKLSL